MRAYTTARELQPLMLWFIFGNRNMSHIIPSDCKADTYCMVLNRCTLSSAVPLIISNVVVCVDGRGTGGRGRAFSDVVYRRLGHYETIDQIAAARYAASLPFVDGSRIGIYGWSYGGYEALMCASADASPFAAAVSVAPVTDWRYYDTVYAERYMLTPQQNADGSRQGIFYPAAWRQAL